jgi:hypothetical protein
MVISPETNGVAAKMAQLHEWRSCWSARIRMRFKIARIEASFINQISFF